MKKIILIIELMLITAINFAQSTRIERTPNNLALSCEWIATSKSATIPAGKLSYIPFLLPLEISANYRFIDYTLGDWNKKAHTFGIGINYLKNIGDLSDLFAGLNYLTLADFNEEKDSPGYSVSLGWKNLIGNSPRTLEQWKWSWRIEVGVIHSFELKEVSPLFKFGISYYLKQPYYRKIQYAEKH